MASLNKVMLIGNLTRDVDLRYTPKGNAVADLGIAVTEKYKTESGEKRETTVFCDVTLWGRTAEVAGEYLKKGRPVYIEGKLVLDQWDDKQTGQKRSKLKVTGETIQLLGTPKGSEDRPQNRSDNQRQEQRKPAAPPKPPVDPDLDPGEDCPF